jgi:CheY-like chemotaxis protein
VEVEDTGIGIEAEKLSGLFQRFTQADSSTTRRYGGTGLGLAIVRELAELMGGRVEVASEKGKGSRFSFEVELPAHGPAAAQEPPLVPVHTPRPVGGPGFERALRRLAAEITEQQSSGLDSPLDLEQAAMRGPITSRWLGEKLAGQKHVPRAGERMESIDRKRFLHLRVLLVGDNIVNQKVGVRLLEKLGCRVDVAANGFEAVAMIEQFPFDLVLMDCQMPEMDGYQATRQIRGRGGAKAAMPILALTAAATSLDRERCFDAGMNDFLTKPVTVESLIEALAKWAPAPSGGASGAGGGIPASAPLVS